MNIQEIILKFNIKGNIQEIKESYTGNINNTYMIRTQDGEEVHNYVLQKINVSVF